MAQTTVAINLEAKTKGTESVKSLKTQIKEATQDAIALSQKFGEFSPQAIEAAQKVAKLKDEMQDFQQRVAALNPDKFDAIGKVVGGVASGFSAAQGAMALFGSESEDLQKTLIKVQGAMAMAQGIQGVLDARKQFVALGSTAINAFKGMTAASKAFMLTGIGLIITAIGALIGYWDDIKGAINGVSTEQKKLNEVSEKGLETEKEKTTALEKSENTLKLQSKSERQIRDLKIQQYNAEIAKAQAVLKNAKVTRDLEIAAAKRNRETTIGIIKSGQNIASFALKALAMPIDALINTANKVSEILGFGQITTLQVSEEIDKMNKSISETSGTWLFDPEQVAKDGDATIKAAESTVQDLISKRDGLILAGREADKKAAEDARVSAANARQQALENAAKMAALNQKTLEEQIAAADAAFKVNEAQLRKNGLTELQIGALRDAELEKVRTAYYEKKAADDQKALDEAIAKAQKETDEIYKLREKALVDRKASDDEFAALELERLNAQLENAKKYKQSEVELELQIAKKKKEIYDKDAENKKLAEEAKKDFQEKTLQATYDSLAALQGILKEGSDAAKAAALLDIAIKTGVGFAQGLDIAQKGAAGKGPAAPYAFPIFYAQQIAAVLGAVSRAKSILKGGSGGGSTGGGVSATPSAPTFTPITGGALPDEQQFGGMGRVYVLEGDITKTQTRVRRLRNTSVV